VVTEPDTEVDSLILQRLRMAWRSYWETAVDAATVLGAIDEARTELEEKLHLLAGSARTSAQAAQQEVRLEIESALNRQMTLVDQMESLLEAPREDVERVIGDMQDATNRVAAAYRRLH
jgi:hypothetical protein